MTFLCHSSTQSFHFSSAVFFLFDIITIRILEAACSEKEFDRKFDNHSMNRN